MVTHANRPKAFSTPLTTKFAFGVTGGVLRRIKGFSEPLKNSKLPTGSGIIAHYVSDLRNNYPHLNIFHLDVRSEPLENSKPLPELKFPRSRFSTTLIGHQGERHLNGDSFCVSLMHNAQ